MVLIKFKCIPIALTSYSNKIIYFDNMIFKKMSNYLLTIYNYMIINKIKFKSILYLLKP